MKRESNVSTPFMEKLREELKDLNGQVIKHYDASMIGLVDCSVTIPDHRVTLWLEFKLWVPTKKWSRERGPLDYLKIARDEVIDRKTKQPKYLNDVQFQKAKKLNALYIFWVYKSDHITLWNPRAEQPVIVLDGDTTLQMVKFVSSYIRREIASR